MSEQTFIRIVCTTAAPFIVLWAFTSELWRGIRTAWMAAKLEAGIEWDSYRRHMEELRK